MKLDDIVLCIPHSSVHIPPDIRERIPHSDDVLLREPDLYTDRLYTIDGTRVVEGRFSRIIGDCNRAPDEIYTENKLRYMGVVMLCLAEGYDTFTEDPSIEEMEKWINRFHRPFHDELEGAMKSAKFLLDCHSLSSVGAAAHIDAGRQRADIVLGNREYTTCSAETTQWFRAHFEALGYSVSINDPYPGRYILGAYCSRLRAPGLQVEINRKLYMNEETLEPYEDVITRFNGEIDQMLQAFCEWDEKRGSERPMTDLSEQA